MRLERIASLLLLIACTVPSSAAVFNNYKRWKVPASGYLTIPVCIDPESTTQQTMDDFILVHDPIPSLDTVVLHIRRALAGSWEAQTGLRFTGWKHCDQISAAEKVNSQWLLISPLATGNEGIIGGQAGTRSIQFMPWGPPYARCMKYNWSTAHVEYTFDCVEQYAIHEFGHLIGFEHEWRSPAKPSGCQANPNEPQISSYDYATTYDLNKGYTVPTPNTYDWDSIMTYGSDCAHVTGVRFGSKSLSASDATAAEIVYGRGVVHGYDVGVLAGANGCGPGYESLMIHMDTENNDSHTNATGWIGGTLVNPNINFAFCRVDGSQFKPTAYSGSLGDYAVLQLGAMCPAGSWEFTRLEQNERNLPAIFGTDFAINGNYTEGNVAPNRQTIDGMTELHFCLYAKELATTGYMDSFPTFPFEYGVFAGPNLHRNLQAGQIYADDEDEANHNLVMMGNSSLIPRARAIIAGNENTTFNVAKVFSGGFPIYTKVTPERSGLVTPASGTLVAPGSSVQLTATPQEGYLFMNWADGEIHATRTVNVNAPATYTAIFEGQPTNLNVVLGSKSGTQDRRIWGFYIDNKGPGAVVDLTFARFDLTQVDSGPRCTPVVTKLYPPSTLVPHEGQLFQNILNFSSCPAGARFTLTYALSANKGGFVFSRTLYNQFQ